MTSEAGVEEIEQRTAEAQTEAAQTTEAQTTEVPSFSTSTSREEEVGRKIFVTKSGEKYHLDRRCRTLRGYRSYEKEPCTSCKESPQRVLIFNQSQPTP